RVILAGSTANLTQRRKAAKKNAKKLNDNLFASSFAPLRETSFPASKQRADVLDGPAEHCAVAAFDDGSLQQLRMLNQQRDDLFIRQLALAQPQLAVLRFVLA